MIKSITVTNHLGDSIKLILTKPEESGFIVESVTGLGPGKATINASEIPTTDGAIYNSARMSGRNIVLSLKFLWKETIEDVRQLSYKYFPIKKKVRLTIETDNRLSEIEGYVESNEPNIFSKEEGSDISIICPDPFFYAAGQTQVTSFSAVEPMFEFPFSNESLTEPMLEMSAIVSKPYRVINYIGDSEIGITIHIRANGNAENITIYNVETREEMKIYTNIIQAITGSGIVDKDEIVICTVKGSKSAKLIRTGKTINILNALDKHSDWFQISKGENILAYSAESGQNNLVVEIENRIIYEGV